MNDIRHPRNGQSSAQSGADTPSSQGSGGQQSSSQSTTTSPSDSPLATPSYDTSPPASAHTRDIFERLTDPLQALATQQSNSRRADLESAARVTHSTNGPHGPLGLSVGHQEQVSSHISPSYARVGGPITGLDQANIGLTVERNAATLSATSNVHHGAITAGASNIAGFYNGQMSFTSTAGANVGGLIGATKDGLMGVGFNTIHALTANIGFGASVVGLADPNATKVVTAVEGDGHANVEHKRMNYLGGQASVSIGMPQVGMAMRVYAADTVVRSKEQRVTTAQAKEALGENSFLSRRAIGIGIKPAFPGRHGIDYTQDVAKGETSSEQRMNNVTRSVAVSGAGVHLGRHLVRNSGSQVKLKRSNSGNRTSLNFAETQSSTSAYTLDVPVIASVTRSTFTERSSEIEVALTEEQDASKLFRRSKSLLGLNQALSMSMDLRGEDLAKAGSPAKAVKVVRQETLHSGVSIQRVSHSTRKQLSSTRGSIMPLMPAMFGARASSNIEGGVSEVRRYTANHDSAEFVAGRERSIRKEVWRRGVQEETASYLHVNSLEITPSLRSGAEQVVERQATYLTAKSSLLQCDFSGLNKLNEWTEQFKDREPTAPSSPLTNQIDPFSATAHVTVRLDSDDKLKLAQKGLFKSLRRPTLRADALQQQQFVEDIDRELTKMVEADTDVVITVAQMLATPSKVEVNVEVDLVDKLAQEVNQASVQSSPILGPSSVRARKKLANLGKLMDKASSMKKIFNHPLFYFTPVKQAQMREQLNSVQAQLKETANGIHRQQKETVSVPSFKESLPAQRSIEPVSRVESRSAVTAADITVQEDAESGDIGLIPLQSFSQP